MKSSLAVLLFFAGFVLVFSDHDEFEILTPEGNYKQGAVLMWIPILEQLKKFTESEGHNIIEKMKTYLKPADEAFQNNDFPTLVPIFAEVGQMYLDLVPYITNTQLAAAVITTGNGCVEAAEKLKTTSITLKELAVFEKAAAILMTSTMEQEIIHTPAENFISALERNDCSELAIHTVQHRSTQLYALLTSLI